MDTRKSPENDVINDAEHIVYREKWRVCEERAAERLASTTSLKWTRLFSETSVIQVVAIDGLVVGHICVTGAGGSQGGQGNTALSPTARPSVPPSWHWHAKRSLGERRRGPPPAHNPPEGMNPVDLDLPRPLQRRQDADRG